MKKNYTKPEIEVIVLDAEDVITASGEVLFDTEGLFSKGAHTWY